MHAHEVHVMPRWAQQSAFIIEKCENVHKCYSEHYLVLFVSSTYAFEKMYQLHSVAATSH